MKTIDIIDEATLLLAFSSSKIVVNTNDNHYKFYTYVPESNKVIFYYGAIGKSPRMISKDTFSIHDSIRKGNEKLREEIRIKGYRPLNFEERDLR